MSDDVNKLLKVCGCRSQARGTFSRSNPINETRCSESQVDVTRVRLAPGKLALAMLEQKLPLNGEDPDVLKETIGNMVELLKNSEEISKALKLGLAERLADLLVSEDPYLREKVAIIYGTMCGQNAGREAILRHPKILNHLSRGLSDPLSVVREKMALVIETLARDINAAEDLCVFGFIKVILDRIVEEKEDTILAIHLECLESLMLLNSKVKIRAIEINAMEKLFSLIQTNNEEKVMVGALACLAILCQVPLGKEKSMELDILPILKTLLDDQRGTIRTKTAAVIVFATITTRGKRRAVELEMADKLAKMAVDFTRDREFQLASIKALSNIAEVPEARSMLLSSYCMLIEDIDTHGDETAEKHKNILLEIIRWRP